MPYASATWNYKDPITTQKMGQMNDNSVWTSEHNIYGAGMDITGNTTVQIGGGAMAIGNAWLREDVEYLTALTADNATHWEGGNGYGSSTAWWVVAFGSGVGFNVLFRQSAPAYSDTNSATSTGPKLYDKTGSTWYRYIATVVNGTATQLDVQQSNIIGGKVLQQQTKRLKEVLTGATPFPDTAIAATATLGIEIMTMSFRPLGRNSRLEIDAEIQINRDNVGSISLGLFQDAISTALRAVTWHDDGSTRIKNFPFTYIMPANTAGSIDFKIRGGCHNADVIYINGDAAHTATAAKIFGEGYFSKFTVTEWGR